ncbi:MAG: hypothetical protein DRP45_09230 [Candidatus Zixiibacteriota bacterium]|nr:MAG: hypothetical protein DRP45_09230 [candidate division Zixibacteria bacterium]
MPNARFSGPVQPANQLSFDALVWNDLRPKPSWTDIESEAKNYLREEIYRQVNIAKEIMIVTATTVTISSGTFEFDSDAGSREAVRETEENYDVVVADAAAAGITPFTWRTADNLDVVVTQADLLLIRNAIRASWITAHAISRVIKDAVEAGADPPDPSLVSLFGLDQQLINMVTVEPNVV